MKYLLGTPYAFQLGTSSLGPSGKVTTTFGYDNSSNLFFWGDIVLSATFSTTPFSGAIDLFLVPAPNGVDHPDSPASPLPTSMIAGSWNLNQSLSQVLIIRGVSLPPFWFNAYVNNGSTVTMLSGWSAIMYPYCAQ